MTVTTRGARKRERESESKLPHDVCVEVAKHMHESEALAFSMTCRGFRDAMREAMGRKRRGSVTTSTTLLETSRWHYLEIESVPVSEDWIKWAFSMKWEYADEDDENLLDVNRKYKSTRRSERRKEKKKAFLVELAARGGYKDLLCWLKSRRCVFDVRTAYGAALGGQIEVLKYLKSEGVEFRQRTGGYAAKGGHIEVLKYLKSEGMPLGSGICCWAAGAGHIEVLKYLRSERAPFCEDAANAAAAGGRIDVLKYLKSVGEIFVANTCNCAAEGGHVDVLRYLKSEGFSFDEETIQCAIWGGSIEVVKYLTSNAMLGGQVSLLFQG